MSLLNTLEKRFGRYAIRGIVGYILFFQCIVFAVLYINNSTLFAEKLRLVPFVAMDGEWWRLVSFMAVPDARGLLSFIFSVFIALICAARIEPDFGTFRLNLFILFYMVCQWALAAVAGTALGTLITEVTGARLMPGKALFFSSSLLFTNLFFVFAVMEPKRVFLLFGLVPIAVWILALLNAGFIFFSVVRDPSLWLIVLVSLGPFLCFGVPIFIKYQRHRLRVGARRTRFRAESLDAGSGFHTCRVCGRTDASDPDLDFRVAEDGSEYCADHLPRS